MQKYSGKEPTSVKSLEVDLKQNKQEKIEVNSLTKVILAIQNRIKAIISKKLQKQSQNFNTLSMQANRRIQIMQKASIYKTLIIKFTKSVNEVLAQICKQYKHRMTIKDSRQWKQVWNEYLQDEYVRQHQQNNEILAIKSCIINNFRNFNIADYAAKIDDYEHIAIQNILNKSLKLKSIITQHTLCQQKLQIIQLIVRLQLKLQNIFTTIVTKSRIYLQQTLSAKIQDFQFKYINIYDNLKLSFRELNKKLLKIIEAGFIGESINPNLIKMQENIQKQLKNNNFNKDLLKKSIQQYFIIRFQNIVKNVNKKLQDGIFSKYNKDPTQFIQKRKPFYQVVILDLDKFVFSFNFPNQKYIFVKMYQSWWRGKLSYQKQLMYIKHLHILHFLRIVKPHGTVNYYDVKELNQGKQIKFVMQKGTKSWTCLQQGYSHFQELNVKQKIIVLTDICQALVQLSFYGINHNDVTMRNLVMCGDSYKFIDFDVARMIDININFQKIISTGYCDIDIIYKQSRNEQFQQEKALKRLKSMFFIQNKKQDIRSLQSVEELLLHRKEVIRCTKQLMKKQLRIENIITRTDPKKPTTPVENINRLSQFFDLKNDNQLIKLFQQGAQKKSRIYHDKFTKQERLALIYEYQKLIVGKRDCNKYAFMVLKLLFKPNKGMSITYLNTRVNQFIKQLYKVNQEKLDYNKYTQIFKLDVSISQSVNQKILRLLVKLMRPSLRQRIPAKLFIVQFLQILQIQQFNFNLPEQLYASSSEDLYTASFNIFDLLDLNKPNRQAQINKIYDIFKKTKDLCDQHHNQFLKKLKKIKNVTRDKHLFQFYDNPNKLNKQSKATNIIIEFVQFRMKQFFNKFKLFIIKDDEKKLCPYHKLNIQAQCLHNTCQNRWLCRLCLSDIAHHKTTSKIQHYNILENNQRKYHKISHIHSLSKNKQQNQIICAVQIKGKYEFKCTYCLNQIQKSFNFQEIYLLKPDSLEMMNYLCFNEQCNEQFPHLLSLQSNPVPKQGIQHIQLSQLMDNIQSIDLKQSSKEQIMNYTDAIQKQSVFAMKKIGQTAIQMNKLIFQSCKLQQVKEILQIMKIMPKLLQEMRYRNRTQSLQRQLQQLKLINSQNATLQNIKKTCEYYIDEFMQKLINYCEQLSKQIQKWKKQSSQLMFHHRLFFKYYNLTSNHMQTILKVPNISKLPPNRYQHMKKKQNQTQDLRIGYKQKQKQKSKSSSFYKNKITQNEQSQYEPVDLDQKFYQNYKICQQCSLHHDNELQIKQICLQKTCQFIFICKHCMQKHKQHKIYKLSHIKYQTERHQIEANQNLQQIKNKMQYTKILSVIQKLYSQLQAEIKQEIIQPIQFIFSLCQSFGNLFSLKRSIYKKLVSCIYSRNQEKYASTIWIMSHLSSQEKAVKFLKVISYSFQRYSTLLRIFLQSLKRKHKNMEQINQQQLFTEKNMNKIEIKAKQKYQKIINYKDMQKPCYFDEIQSYNHLYVKSLQLYHFDQNKEGQYKAQDLIEIQLNQFKKKWKKLHFNGFQIDNCQREFMSVDSSLWRVNFAYISNFKNLQEIIIQNQPNWKNPFVFTSLNIQRVFQSVDDLKKLKLKCLNGFDRYCMNLLRLKHKNLEQLQIYSYMHEVFSFNKIVQFFDEENKIVIRLTKQGQLFTLKDIQQILQGNGKLKIKAAQFRIFLTKDQIQDAYYIITQMTDQMIVAHKIELKLNHLLYHQCLQGQPIFYLIRKLYVCRKFHNNKKLTSSLQTFIQSRYDKIKIMLQIIPQKFINIMHLSLHGFLIGPSSNQKSDQVDLALNKLLSSMQLHTLELFKCFGLSLNILTINSRTLKRLMIDTCSLRNVKMTNYSWEWKMLQFLYLKRVTLFTLQNFLNSHELADILHTFNFKQLKCLILSDFYQLQAKNATWISNCPLQRLSFRRCTRINDEIIKTVKRITTLKHLDLTKTDTTQEQIKNFILQTKSKIKVKYANKIDSLTVQNSWIVRQINRIAKAYKIQSILKLSQDEFGFYNLKDIKEIKIHDMKIRQKQKYYIFYICAKLPSIRSICLEDLQWLDGNQKIYQPIKFYNSFPFIQGFRQLKQLSLTKLFIRYIQECHINQYKHLRKLVLRQNLIQSITNIQLQALVYLDVSYNPLASFNIQPRYLKSLMYINLYKNKLREYPVCLDDCNKLILSVGQIAIKIKQLNKEETGDKDSKRMRYYQKLQQQIKVKKTQDKLISVHLFQQKQNEYFQQIKQYFSYLQLLINREINQQNTLTYQKYQQLTKMKRQASQRQKQKQKQKHQYIKNNRKQIKSYTTEDAQFEQTCIQSISKDNFNYKIYKKNIFYQYLKKKGIQDEFVISLRDILMQNHRNIINLLINLKNKHCIKHNKMAIQYPQLISSKYIVQVQKIKSFNSEYELSCFLIKQEQTLLNHKQNLEQFIQFLWQVCSEMRTNKIMLANLSYKQIGYDQRSKKFKFIQLHNSISIDSNYLFQDLLENIIAKTDILTKQHIFQIMFNKYESPQSKKHTKLYKILQNKSKIAKKQLESIWQSIRSLKDRAQISRYVNTIQRNIQQKYLPLYYQIIIIKYLFQSIQNSTKYKILQSQITQIIEKKLQKYQNGQQYTRQQSKQFQSQQTKSEFSFPFP